MLHDNGLYKFTTDIDIDIDIGTVYNVYGTNK